jgi:hypothetical protein
VEYWIYKAVGTSITPQNCISLPQCKTTLKATSPALITGLYNGINYSFTVNGRTGGGKGGPGSPSISALPRLAGATWAIGNPVGMGSPLVTEDLYGLTYGSVFVAAGAKGALFSSVDGIIWSALTNPVPSATLYAATYSAGKYIVVGSGGLILLSTDAVTWTQQTSGTTYDLYAVTNNGAGGFIAAGANGTTVASGDGVNWILGTTGTTKTLYGITYGASSATYAAVGAAGTLLTSADGATWNAISSTGTNDLKAISYGGGLLVAVGAAGTLITSVDGYIWTVQSPISTSVNLNTVVYGHQFVSIDNNGVIYNSTDGVTWLQVQKFTSPLYAVVPAQSLAGQFIYQYVYSAVGAGGANLLSR